MEWGRAGGGGSVLSRSLALAVPGPAEAPIVRGVGRREDSQVVWTYVQDVPCDSGHRAISRGWALDPEASLQGACRSVLARVCE